MKTLALVTATGLAAFLSLAASAQTGRPSAVEVPAAADAPTASGVGYGQTAGSYARYLMLNGATRENALVAARNVDNPVERAPRLAANRGKSHQPSPQ
jgi:hypothetical protein